MQVFERGDRVRLSKLGESRVKKPRSKSGRVVGFGFSDARIRALFDGLREPVTLHHSYLERELAAHAETKRRPKR